MFYCFIIAFVIPVGSVIVATDVLLWHYKSRDTYILHYTIYTVTARYMTRPIAFPYDAY